MLAEVCPEGVQGGTRPCSQEDRGWWWAVRLTASTQPPPVPSDHQEAMNAPVKIITRPANQSYSYQRDQQQSCSRAKICGGTRTPTFDRG